jgi:predicted transglutaminase-like cysteine proteinase
MRKISILAAVAAAALIAGFQSANAGLLGMPMGLQSAIQHIKFETPTLAPTSYAQFCLRCEEERRSRITFRGGPVQLTAERSDDLKGVNQEVSNTVDQDIAPERNEPGLAGATWLRIVAIATTMLTPTATNFSIAAIW